MDDDFVELLLEGDPEGNQAAMGSYNHLGWVVYAGRNSEADFATLTSLHEAQHHTLNNSTAYGNLLMVVAYLARETGEARYMQMLLSLARHCRQTHEIYATYSSFLALGSSKHFDLDEPAFVAQYPNYKVYLEQAQALLPKVPSPLLQILALESVAKGCLNNPAVIEACLPDLANFVPSKLRIGEYPDSRLRKLGASLSSEFWDGVLSRLIAAGPEDVQGLIMQLLAQDQNPFDLEEGQYILLTQHLSQHFDAAIGSLLLNHGQRSMSSGQHLEYLHDLLAAADQIAPMESATIPLVVNRHSEEIHDLIAYTRETNHISKTPLEAVVHNLADIPSSDWEELKQSRGGTSYFFLVSRLRERLMGQYNFSEQDKTLLLARDSPFVTCLRKRVKQGGDWRIELYLLDSPDQVLELSKQGELLSNTSMLLLAAKRWRAWHQAIALTQHTVLFDLSPIEHLERTLARQFDQISVHKATLSVAGSVQIALVFVASGALSGLFVAPCSNLASNAIIHYIRNYLDGSKFCEDQDRFEQHKTAIGRTLYALLTEETAFDFNAIQSHFAREGFKHGEFA